MKTQKITHRNFTDKVNFYESAICNWSGMLVSISLIAFFLFMKTIGLHEILVLRYFNFIFLFFGIVTTFHKYRKKISRDRIDYLTGIKMGLRISLIAVIPFALFIGIYLRIDENFMLYLKENAEFGQYLNPAVVAGIIGIEGFVSGAITTFIAMQYFKDNSDDEW